MGKKYPAFAGGLSDGVLMAQLAYEIGSHFGFGGKGAVAEG